ncbi:POT family-domain-containing protein [Kalaharituber pfeilii]|nr:POT family-domain-containing protein [Kalaharituber pfeilii]
MDYKDEASRLPPPPSSDGSPLEPTAAVPGIEKVELNTSPSNASTRSNVVVGLDGEEPTEHDFATLRRVSDKIPIGGYLVAVVEMTERFAYYGLSAPFQNYMQNDLNDPLLPGALGLGQSTATGLQYFWNLWSYVSPLIGAVVADQYMGRYNTIMLFAVIYVLGLLILVTTSIPSSIEGGHAYGGFLASIVVIGLGSGGIKSNVSPLIAEQYRSRGPFVRTLKSGERVLVDPNVTIQRIYMMFYWCINFGSLSGIATVYMEKYIGFWAAYLLPFCMFFVGILTLIVGRKYYVTAPPQGSVILQAFKAWYIALRNGANLNVARPSYQDSQPGGRKYKTPWSDTFIDELRRSLVACKVFLFYPIFWVCYGQMASNFISMAGDMNTHGLPNDVLFNTGAITIIIFIPLLDKIFYPLLRRMGIIFRPITRITWGFFFAAASMGYAAGLQDKVYKTGPCYESPRDSTCLEGTVPNDVHVAIQTPCYALMGLAEICASVTGLEYAYTKAPATMKSFIMAIFLLTNAGGSVLGIAVSPTFEHPKLVWAYTGLAAVTAVTGILFWICFRNLNALEEQMNADGREVQNNTVTKIVGGGPSSRDIVADEKG